MYKGSYFFISQKLKLKEVQCSRNVLNELYLDIEIRLMVPFLSQIQWNFVAMEGNLRYRNIKQFNVLEFPFLYDVSETRLQLTCYPGQNDSEKLINNVLSLLRLIWRPTGRLQII